MDSEKVKEYLNKYLLNNDIFGASRLGYRDMMLDILKSLVPNANLKEQKLFEIIADGMAEISIMPRKPSQLLIYTKPESFKSVELIHSRFVAAAKYTIENYDDLRSNVFKVAWPKDIIILRMQQLEETMAQLKNVFTENGALCLSNLFFEALKEFFCWSAQTVLGDTDISKFVNEFNSSLKVFNNYAELMSVAIKTSPAHQAS